MTLRDDDSILAATGIWNGLSTTFNSGSSTMASLFLRNAQTASFGNDFAIDDISLDTRSIVNPMDVPEPAAAGLMLLGCSGLAFAAHRRRAKGTRSGR
ncbi:PEP-CTERM sorting domain-containing protein [Pacificimonas sp. WHA3]|uniref:PEP-CTERM sorting domain-containing protein n=1 Tax=Pacificimonas pallii TaxID=2827236 RepID=A0ABS6SGR1_9SPHN|nr:PEP-CTERM sorting domain-containing protein [Pacificimonas pallii]